MKRVFCVLAFVSVALYAQAAFCAGTDAVDTVEGLASGVIGHFPRAEGKVTFAEDKAVKFDIGSSDGLKAGMELFLFRPGQAIKHPVTKKPLGTREEPLGRAVLTEVSEKESKGELKELLVTRILPGDTARLSTDRKKLLLAIHGSDYNELVKDRLTGSLSNSGRFDIMGPAELPKDAKLGPEEAAALIREKGAEYLLALKTAPAKRPGRTEVALTLYGPDGAVATAPSGTVDATSDIYVEEVLGHKLVGGERRDFFRMDNLPYRARHLASGNVTGEGRTELAVSDGDRVIVYRLEGGVLKELWREQGSSMNRHLSLECADLNGNGRDEIYVTNYINDTVSSYVLEYDGKTFGEIGGRLAVLFRVLEVPGSGRMLIAGSLGKLAPWSGVINEYAWKEGKLAKAGRVSLPNKIKDPYGFALVDLVPDKKGAAKGKGPFAGLEIVWVDDSDYVQVLDMKGKRLWKSPERYGGYDNFFEVDEEGLPVDNVDNRGKVKGRLFVRTGPAGSPEIILTKNIAMTYAVRRFRGYSGAEIYSLAWNGSALDVKWSIRNIEGYLSGISMGDVTNSGREDIAVVTSPTFKLKKASKTVPLGSAASLMNTFADKSTLLVYKVPLR